MLLNVFKRWLKKYLSDEGILIVALGLIAGGFGVWAIEASAEDRGDSRVTLGAQILVFALLLLSGCGKMRTANPNPAELVHADHPPLGGATLVLLLAVVFVTAVAA